MDTITMLSREFLKRHPLQAARILEGQPIEDIAAFLEDASAVSAAQVLTIMDTVTAERCLSIMSPEGCASIVADIPLEVAAIYMRSMTESRRKNIIDLMPEEIGSALRKILNYPEGTVGSIMDPLVFMVPEDAVVKDVLKRLHHQERHILDYVYIVDRNKALIGFSTHRDLMVGNPRNTVSYVLQKCDERLSPTTSVRAVMNHPAWSEFRALPVVDENGIFLGAVEHRTLRRIAAKKPERREGDPVRSTASALGELFVIGVSGLMQGAAYAMKREE